MNIEEWYCNGKLHRTDGPAKIKRFIGSYEEWFLNGKTHRTDGPAITFSDGNVAYVIDGKVMTLEEFSRQYMITHLCEYVEANEKRDTSNHVDVIQEAKIRI